ncbi:hypothetical protein Trco_001154 [Trichoderma cornu-damae]|uniref:DUF1531-domain-containing protein n=1 Tax=Trichoderma cornu-damae TaxID=654480 RepID=A0A9P8TZP4_9HYPO|nr:hypothetical protein Trco_001154 [Trichoderma cornu-damae]
MDSQSHQQYQQDDAGQASLNTLGSIVARLSQYGQNASSNIQKSFGDMTTQGWLRLLMVVCTYLLIRPHIIKYSTKYAVNKLEEQDAKDKKQAQEAVAKMSPNDLRGLNSAAEADVDADEGAGGSSADWGSKARVRQRKMLRKMLEAEEQRRWEEEDDEDIRDLLE